MEIEMEVESSRSCTKQSTISKPYQGTLFPEDQIKSNMGDKQSPSVELFMKQVSIDSNREKPFLSLQIPGQK